MAASGPGITDIKRLFARSGNRCAFPKCTATIAEGDTLIGEVCHINAIMPQGQRYASAQTPEQRHAYDNLILLCPSHHTVVDDDEETYTVERLRRMKAEHEDRINPASEEQASRIAELFVHQGSNIAHSGAVAASIIHAQNFNIHQPVTDTLTQARRLQAIEKLWEVLRRLNSEFNDLCFIHTILTPEEMVGYFKNGWPLKFNISNYVAQETLLKKMSSAGCGDAERERPFVSARLWGIFHIIRAIYGRLGFLCDRSFHERRFVDWRSDSGIDELLRTTLPSHTIDELKKSRFYGVVNMIDHLEIQFVSAAGMNPK